MLIKFDFYVQNKIISFLRKKYPQFFSDHYDFIVLKFYLSKNFMNPTETKKNLILEIKKGLKKSKLEELTNENDFLVKNLKKAGDIY